MVRLSVSGVSATRKHPWVPGLPTHHGHSGSAHLPAGQGWVWRTAWEGPPDSEAPALTGADEALEMALLLRTSWPSPNGFSMCGRLAGK